MNQAFGNLKRAGRSRLLTATGNSQQRGVPGRQQELTPTKKIEIPEH